MTRLQLSNQQKSFFECFGYIVMPGLLKDSIGEIQDAFEEVWLRHDANDGHKHDGMRRSMIVPFIDQHERLCALLDDPKIEKLVEGLLGEGFNYVGSDGNFYVGDSQWHSDRWISEVRFVKVAFYLDSLKSGSGCLRVLPGSHRLGDRYSQQLQANVKDSMLIPASERWGISGSDVPAAALETEPGDVVVFAHNLKHAAFGGGSRRRMFTINCCERVPDRHLNILHDCISDHARGYGIDSMYDEKMLATAGPQRHKHLAQVLANQGHMAAEVEKWQAQQGISQK